MIESIVLTILFFGLFHSIVEFVIKHRRHFVDAGEIFSLISVLACSTPVFIFLGTIHSISYFHNKSDKLYTYMSKNKYVFITIILSQVFGLRDSTKRVLADHPYYTFLLVKSDSELQVLAAEKDISSILGVGKPTIEVIEYFCEWYLTNHPSYDRDLNQRSIQIKEYLFKKSSNSSKLFMRFKLME